MHQVTLTQVYVMNANMEMTHFRGTVYLQGLALALYSSQSELTGLTWRTLREKKIYTVISISLKFPLMGAESVLLSGTMLSM